MERSSRESPKRRIRHNGLGHDRHFFWRGDRVATRAESGKAAPKGGFMKRAAYSYSWFWLRGREATYTELDFLPFHAENMGSIPRRRANEITHL